MSEIISKRKGRRPMPEATRRKIIDLYNADEMSGPEIAAACGVSVPTVFRIIRAERNKESEVKQYAGLENR